MVAEDHRRANMTSREKIREQRSGYLDGELKDADRRAVDRALADDPELARELSELKRVRELLRDLPRTRAPREFVSQVLGRAERKQLVGIAPAGASAGGSPWTRLVASAAVLLIGVGITVVVAVVLRSPPLPEATLTRESPRSQGELARDVAAMAEQKVPSDKPALSDAYGQPKGAPKEGEVEEIADERKVARESNAKSKEDLDESVHIMQDRSDLAGTVDKTKPARESFKVVNELGMSSKVRGARAARKTAEAIKTRGFGYARPASAEPRIEARSARPLERLEKKEVLEDRLPPARNAILFTHDLSGTQRVVEKMLVSNQIVPLVVREPSQKARYEKTPRVGAYMQLGDSTSEQVQYVAYLTREQIVTVTSELESIRRQQVVSQRMVVAKRSIVPGEPALFAAKKEPPATCDPWVAVEEDAAGRLRLKAETRAYATTRATVDEQIASSLHGVRFAEKVQPLVITLNYRSPERPHTSGAAGTLQSRPATVPASAESQ